MLAVFAVMATPAHADDVEVTASVSPAVVPVGNNAVLTITVRGKFRRTAAPQLPTLEDIYVFESGTSQNFSLVNGQVPGTYTEISTIDYADFIDVNQATASGSARTGRGPNLVEVDNFVAGSCAGVRHQEIPRDR